MQSQQLPHSGPKGAPKTHLLYEPNHTSPIKSTRIIIACLPTLAPLFSKYLKPVVSKARGSKKSTGQRHPMEAQNTFGGGNDSRSFNAKRNWVRLDKEQALLELEEGGNFSKAEAMVRSTSSIEDEEAWTTQPNAIGVRGDIRVYGEPQKQGILLEFDL